ncbi:4-(cytidine 5'-diphospho)-2-C-methyl-D-erythritol kinase [Candidatus Riesia pediculischaeffi]|uniref:4-diphosphocytidyl-2-C-methyl-D-erythritol kinase n=1 Tax=Candidatus Riesia pediculischaeffi TaxID=428411 RepID=A0A1V0HK48_9ENTR|nr:4-(cytidine 5'-diphospho)-2-C-methyl-D-erythritol kinase [Candidatus Riesia pediculischaeffi]ARC53200.1 hypothetical protein AOQ87_00590 [Candidatus Riesia pediculischaeffi]
MTTKFINTLLWPSPAKINLFLRIIKKRTDEYHEIQTLYHFLNYGDLIKVKERKDNKIRLSSNIHLEDFKKNNLITKAAMLLQRYCISKFPKKRYFGADIYVNKVLPIGSGLGGGSSNAATTLIALDYHWNTKIPKKILLDISSHLGADVPFFINGATSIGENIGHDLYPIHIKSSWYLIAYPKVFVSTKKVFKSLNLKKRTNRFPKSILLKKRYENDLEKIVKDLFPEVKNCIKWFKIRSLRPIMTGTGSCIFVKFSSESNALQILKKTPKWMRCFIAKGVNSSPLYSFKKRVI